MNWFVRYCNAVAIQSQRLAPNSIQHRFCGGLKIAAQTQGNLTGIELADTLKCREILVPHRQPQPQLRHIHSTLDDQLLHDLHPLFGLCPLQRTVCHIAFQHTAGTVSFVGYAILRQRRQPVIGFALQKQRARCVRDLPWPAGVRLAQ